MPIPSDNTPITTIYNNMVKNYHQIKTHLERDGLSA